MKNVGFYLSHNNIMNYPHDFSLDSFNLYNIMLSLITIHAWV